MHASSPGTVSTKPIDLSSSRSTNTGPVNVCKVSWRHEEDEGFLFAPEGSRNGMIDPKDRDCQQRTDIQVKRGNHHL